MNALLQIGNRRRTRSVHRCASGTVSARIIAVLPMFLTGTMGTADDWPMWRHDAARTAETTMALPEKTALLWKRQLPRPRPAFESKRLQFDAGYEPVVLGKQMFVASTVNDSVTAFSTDTGAELWRFYTGGPVRCAPVAAADCVYVGSDDGRLYCLDAANGTLQWSFRTAPSTRMLLGNQRLISVWAVRGGPVIKDGVVYFAAGVWPFEGVYVCALEADSGKVRWLNDRTGFLYGRHPHDAEALGGISPQGYLLVHGNELIVPCGTAYPARFDAQTGDLRGFQLPVPGRFPGGWFAAGRTVRHEGSQGTANELVFDREVNTERHEDKLHQGKGDVGVRKRITVGDRVLSCSDRFPGVDGPVHTLLAGDSKLFAVGVDGWIYCFGDAPSDWQVVEFPYRPEGNAGPQEKRSEEAREILDAAGTDRGYALALGASGSLLDVIVRQSAFHVVVLEPDPETAAACRRRLDRQGLYGNRVAVLTETSVADLPPYFATLVFAASLPAVDDDWLDAVFATLHPLGGTACLPAGGQLDAALERWSSRESRPPAAEWLIQKGLLTRVTRKGPLPGSTDYKGDWSTSPDDLVRAPMGVLWYGDGVGVFKRAPQPQIVGGVMRLVDKHWSDYPAVKPPYKLSRVTYQDIYTGRILADAEAATAASRFPPLDLGQRQPAQYRPPTQKDPWRPTPPRAGERTNPLTGRTESRVFPKSYGCDGGFDYGYLYTVRSGTAAFYDKRIESGLIHVSGPRSGCSNSIIPAGGVLNVPYFYAGCTCSYPLPTGLALMSMPERYEQWCSWGSSGVEPMRDIVRIGVNFGAPGDRMGENGTLWLNYPDTGGPSPLVDIATAPDNPVWFYRHALSCPESDLPWVTASGVEGLATCTLSGLKPGRYDVRVCFPAVNNPGVFDLAIQKQTVLRRFAPPREDANSTHMFCDIPSQGTLTIALTPHAGKTVISGIEVQPASR